jgi:amidase
LKTTHGRIPLEGVWPLTPSFDTIGPLATTVAGLTLGMQLLEPGFTAASAPARTIGRVRTTGLPEIEDAIDAVLRAAELEVVPLDLTEWATGAAAFTTIYFTEMWEVDHHLAEQSPDGLGEDIMRTIQLAEVFKPLIDDARVQMQQWRAYLAEVFGRVQLLALPTMAIWPPRLDELVGDTTPLVIETTRHTSVFNAAGTPCTAQPVPAKGSPLPASLQLVGPMGSEELLLPTAALVESAVS